MSKFASIKVGELVTLVIPVTVKATGDPYPQSGVTAITVRFKERNSAAAAIVRTGALVSDPTLFLAGYTLVTADWDDLSEGNWLVLAEIDKGSTVKRFAPGAGTLLLKIEAPLT